MPAKLFDLPGYLDAKRQVTDDERERRAIALAAAQGPLHTLEDPIERLLRIGRFWMWAAILGWLVATTIIVAWATRTSN
jgi:hypothetical protein